MSISNVSVEEQDQDLGVILTKAQVAVSVQNFDAAKQRLKTILERDQGYAPAYFELSKIALIQDDLKDAQDNIQVAIENDPRNEEYRAEAEKVARLSSSMSDARRSYDERDYMGAVARYEKVLENHPTFASAYYGMGMAFAREGNLRQAAEAFRKAQANNPDDARYTTALRNIVADKFNKANRLFRGRDWESALEIYKEVVELDPTFEKTYYWMARSYRMLGDNEAALKMLDRAIEIKPDYATAYVEKGDILRRDDRSEEAEAVYRQALSLDPKSDKAWVGLGTIVRSEKPAEAVEAFKSALSVNPENGDAAEYLGEIYSDQEKWAEARKYLEQAVKLKPKDHVVAWWLAHVYNALGEYEKARQMGKRSTDLEKTFEYGWYELGLAEKALGNRVAAIEAFKNALKGPDASIRKSSQYELKQLEMAPPGVMKEEEPTPELKAEPEPEAEVVKEPEVKKDIPSIPETSFFIIKKRAKEAQVKTGKVMGTVKTRTGKVFVSVKNASGKVTKAIGKPINSDVMKKTIIASISAIKHPVNTVSYFDKKVTISVKVKTEKVMGIVKTRTGKVFVSVKNASGKVTKAIGKPIKSDVMKKTVIASISAIKYPLNTVSYFDKKVTKSVKDLVGSIIK